jgi:hypothetical protein
MYNSTFSDRTILCIGRLYMIRRVKGVGRSRSYELKIELFQKAIPLQAEALIGHTGHGRGIIIDCNAGDGDGTPQIICEFAQTYNGLYGQNNLDVVFCERIKHCRILLENRYPHAEVIPDNAYIDEMICPERHRWALIVADPNGYAANQFPTDAFRAISRMGLSTAWVMAFNEGGLARLAGLTKTPYKARFPNDVAWFRDKYLWMRDPLYWKAWLTKMHVYSTDLTMRSHGYQSRLWIVSNLIAESVINDQRFYQR